ncbi:hypothetical protein NT6N_02240 [Oceaniferula spumae]|uniref:STAS domain-containing protein n=1 Tax=Oceaniferula spumae TaxID=2979115 RepID=A0AAT9FGT9_9BACT
MSTEHPISAYRASEFSWIRCAGKGSFLNSHALKEWAENEMKDGATIIVVDLEACTGMDSTFMGTMAGLAMRLMKIPGGKLQIAEPGERNRQSLEDLGLDVLMEIEPEESVWKDQVSEVREKLVLCGDDASGIDKAPHVLEAHKTLCAADEKNTKKFATVLDFLEAEVKAKKAANK